MAGVSIGYAPLSAEDKNLDSQIGALEAAGCESIYEDNGISSAGGRFHLHIPTPLRRLFTTPPLS